MVAIGVASWSLWCAWLKAGTVGGWVSMASTLDYFDLRTFLRGFVNLRGDPAPYDAVGLFHLLLAILDNLQEHSAGQDFDDLGVLLTNEQASYLSRLLAAREAAGRSVAR